eukprot:4706903-Pyramimonas_sp.AAC.1
MLRSFSRSTSATSWRIAIGSSTQPQVIRRVYVSIIIWFSCNITELSMKSSHKVFHHLTIGQSLGGPRINPCAPYI